MKKKLLTLVFMLSLSVLILPVSCKGKDSDKTAAAFWKYSDGFYIGDIVDLTSERDRIENDTVFLNNIPVAKFIKIENRILAGDKLLHIEDFASSKSGVYVEK